MQAGIGISWFTNTTTDREDLELSVTNDDNELYFEKGGFQVTLRRIQGGQYTSTLRVIDMSLNKTDLTCEGSGLVEMTLKGVTDNTSIIICIVGKVLIFPWPFNMMKM